MGIPTCSDSMRAQNWLQPWLRHLTCPFELSCRVATATFCRKSLRRSELNGSFWSSTVWCLLVWLAFDWWPFPIPPFSKTPYVHERPCAYHLTVPRLGCHQVMWRCFVQPWCESHSNGCFSEARTFSALLSESRTLALNIPSTCLIATCPSRLTLKGFFCENNQLVKVTLNSYTALVYKTWQEPWQEVLLSMKSKIGLDQCHGARTVFMNLQLQNPAHGLALGDGLCTLTRRKMHHGYILMGIGATKLLT